MTEFTELGLSSILLKALAASGYEKPTPIQAEAIPSLLAGRDLLGVAQTGTGKTAAFALPILQRLAANRTPAASKSCRALIVTPTRELASQIADSFHTYGREYGFRIAIVFGGVPHRPQKQALLRGVDVLVATPGRLLDHIESGTLALSFTEIFVADEADRMLDMGFIPAIRRIVKLLPRDRQSLFFSATMPKEARAIAGEMLKDPVEVAIRPTQTTAERIAQRVHFVDTAGKRDLLTQLLRGEATGRTIVFTRTKHGADRVTRHLDQAGIAAAAIHGDKTQSHRERALDGFRKGTTPVLVATDIAARGIDVDDITHVINFDLPNVPETYVHRIGRTARAGAGGSAISFCNAEERAYLRDIEKLIRQPIETVGTPSGREPAPAEPARGRHAAGRNQRPGKRPHREGGASRQGAGKPRREGKRRPEYQANGYNGDITAMPLLAPQKPRSGNQHPA